ncbi:hypothetical protein [Variovorax boronicumulans]|uniref:hypothetical protein n=1 Tax=Variovorax boronicumulans TaxID=436515 RepID=UPI00339AF4D1
MKSKFLYFAVFLVLPIFVFAAEVELTAKKAFDACMRETTKDRERCDFGGCGNIAGSCYERQIDVVSLATELLVKKLGAERCAGAANSASNEIENLSSKLKIRPPFDSTWSGYDVQMEVALLKYKIMDALAKECARKN